MRPSRSLWFLLLPLLLLPAACGGQRAATPAAQAVLNADAQMHTLAVEHQATANAYFKGCTATPRTIDPPTCHAWDAFDSAFRVQYRETGVKLEAVKVGVGSQAAVDADITNLKSGLAKYKR